MSDSLLDLDAVIYIMSNEIHNRWMKNNEKHKIPIARVKMKKEKEKNHNRKATKERIKMKEEILENN